MSLFKDMATDATDMGYAGNSSSDTFAHIKAKYGDVIDDYADELFDFWQDGHIDYCADIDGAE